MCMERRRFSQTMASEWQTAFVVSHKMPWCTLLTAIKNYNKSLEKLQDFFFKTKTKCSRPRPRLSFLSSRCLETKTLVSRTASLLNGDRGCIMQHLVSLIYTSVSYQVFLLTDLWHYTECIICTQLSHTVAEYLTSSLRHFVTRTVINWCRSTLFLSCCWLHSVYVANTGAIPRNFTVYLLNIHVTGATGKHVMHSLSSNNSINRHQAWNLYPSCV